MLAQNGPIFRVGKWIIERADRVRLFVIAVGKMTANTRCGRVGLTSGAKRTLSKVSSISSFMSTRPLRTPRGTVHSQWLGEKFGRHRETTLALAAPVINFMA